MEDKIILTDNGKKVLAYMQSHDRLLVGKDIAEETGIKGIYPVLNSLVNKGEANLKQELQTTKETNQKIIKPIN